MNRLVPPATALCAFALGCALLPPPGPRLARCGDGVGPVAALPGGDFRRRERVRVRGGAVDVGLTLVAERRGDRLSLVGMTPLGAEAFALVQEGARTERVTPPLPVFPVPPENLLGDFHRRLRGEGEPLPGGGVRVRAPGCDRETLFLALPEAPA